MADDPSAEQMEAERRIMAFLEAGYVPKPWFTLMGLAGTGKTWLLARIARQLPVCVMCSYTGKAASNLARKTGLPATTIHSAIYRFLGKEINDRGEEDLIFMQAVRDGRWSGRVILVDECSMIDHVIARDLIATGARLIMAGDPGQLPPVKGNQFFSTPDFTLTEIRRQAWDSPIIRQAHAVRSGMMYQPDTENFRVEQFVSRDDILDADMILCWRNSTRRALNNLARAHLGYAGLPLVGESIMCLKNDHEMGVLNGAVYKMLNYEQDRSYGGLRITVLNEREEAVELRHCWFEDIDETKRPEDDSVGFTFAYAATVHKAQGSEYPFVIVVDEYNRHDQRERWAYTGITRASERILMQRSW